MRVKLIENFNESNLLSAMESNMDVQDDAYSGPFWYDINRKEVYGAFKSLA